MLTHLLILYILVYILTFKHLMYTQLSLTIKLYIKKQPVFLLHNDNLYSI